MDTDASSSSTTTTGYIQGMSLIINNTETSEEFPGRQNVTESTEIPGAIAIPIQVSKIIFDTFPVNINKTF